MELTCQQAAKLVLGYLKIEDCMTAHQEFLHSCRHLKDVSKSGRYVATRIQGMTLTDILSDYAKVYTIVQERLEETDFYNDRRHRTTFLAYQLLFLLDGQVPTRCSSPNIMSRCSTPYRYSHMDSPFIVQPSPDINTTPLGSLPGNAENKQAFSKSKVPSSSSQSSSNSDSESNGVDKNESTQLAVQTFAESLLKQQELQEKIAENINKVRGTNAKEKIKDGTACDDIDSAIKAVLDKTESDPVFDTLMGEIIGSVNTAQHFPDHGILESLSPRNDQFIPSCFDAPPTSQPTSITQYQQSQPANDLIMDDTRPHQQSQPIGLTITTNTQNQQSQSTTTTVSTTINTIQHLQQPQPTNNSTTTTTNTIQHLQQPQPTNNSTTTTTSTIQHLQQPQPTNNSTTTTTSTIQHQQPQPTENPTTTTTNTAQQQQSQPIHGLKTANINQTQPVDKNDVPKTMPGEIIVYEGSLESYMKNGVGGVPPPANIQTSELHPTDGQKSKQKGKQILFISSTPFNIVPQAPTQIELSQTDIITMPTVIVCDENSKPTSKPVVKKIPPKPEKKVKTLPPKTPTLSEYITLYKCDDDDSSGPKVPEIKTLKTLLPKKNTTLKKVDPPKIEILEDYEVSKPLRSNSVAMKCYPPQSASYSPTPSNFTPPVPNNQFPSATYEPQTNSNNEPQDISNQNGANGANQDLKSSSFEPISNTSSNVNQVQNNLLTSNMYQMQNANITNQVPTSVNQNQVLVGTNNVIDPVTNNFPSTNSTFSSVGNADHNNIHTAVNNTNQPDNGQNLLTVEATTNQNQCQNNLVQSIENNQSNQNLDKRMEAVQNQSNLLKLIQNQNELIQSAQNAETDQTINNELPDTSKASNKTKTNNRKVTITDVVDVINLSGEKSSETEAKKKEKTPADKAEKRKSASTPRSGNKSHVRALDFKFHTPAKDVIDVKSFSSSPAKKKSPGKAKTAKSLFTNPPGSNPIIKKKELIKTKSAGSWDVDLRALTSTDPAVANAIPKPKPKTRRQPAKPKAEPKNKKKPPAADTKKNNSKSEESNSNDKAEADRPSKRTRSKSVKSPQKVITVTTDPHNNECVSIVECEGKVEDLLKSNEEKAATNSESQTHSQISLIKCNAKPRYNKKCNIDCPSRKIPAEEINENTASNSDSKFLTPEFAHPKANEVPSVKKNIMPMLETPVKDVCPKTPRPQSPNAIEDTPFTKVFKESFNDIDLNNIQTPKFLDTPNFALTPLLEAKSPHSHRGTDYSTSSSYYQPSDTEQNKCLESYIKEECKRVQKRITPIKVEESMELETEQINSKIHCNEREQLELASNKTTETTHKAIVEKIKSLSNNVIASKNLSLVNRKIVSSEESSSEDSDSTDSSDSSDSSSSEEDSITKTKSRENSLTRYSLRTVKGNSSKELSEPPEEDIKSILNVTEYSPALQEINVEDEETKRKSQLLAEMEEKRQRTIAIFKNGGSEGDAAVKPTAKKRAPPKPKKSPAKKPPVKRQPVKRNLRSNTKKISAPVPPKDNLQTIMGLLLTSSDEDDLQPLQVVETEMLSSSKSNTPVPDSKSPNTRPLANFEKTLKDLSKKDEGKSKRTEVPKKAVKSNSGDDDKEAQNLVEGLKERGIYLVHKKTKNAKDIDQEKDEKLEDGEIVSDNESKKKTPIINIKKKLNTAPKTVAPKNKPSERNKEKKNYANNKSNEKKKDGNTSGDNKTNKDKKKDGESSKEKEKHGSSSGDNKSKESSRMKSENKNTERKEETDFTKKVEEDIQKSLEGERNKHPQAKTFDQTRRKSIHLEKKIEELKSKKCEQPRKNSHDDTAKKQGTQATKKSATQTNKLAEVVKKPEVKKQPCEEKYDPIDTSCGEHIELDFEFGTNIIEFTYNPDENHRTVTWDKELLYKKRVVDIFVDALGKNITRPIALIGNDNIFKYQPPLQNTRKPVHIIENLKIQSKKPLNVLYNNLVGIESVNNLSTKSPLDELYSDESRQYSQFKTVRQLQNNDRIQGNRVTKKPENVARKTIAAKKNEKPVKSASDEANVKVEAAPNSSKNRDNVKRPDCHNMATPDHSEYDSLMDFSLVLSGTKRKAESDDENGTKRQKQDIIPSLLLNRVNIDEFLNILHKPKET